MGKFRQPMRINVISRENIFFTDRPSRESKPYPEWCQAFRSYKCPGPPLTNHKSVTMDLTQMNVNFQMAINLYLMAEANQGCDGVLEAWAQLLDDHAWRVADDAGQSATANTALLFWLNDVQVILDHVPWIRPDLVLAIYWLIRRDQLILNPNELDRSFA